MGIVDFRVNPVPDYYYEERILPKIISAYPDCTLSELIDIWVSSFDIADHLKDGYKMYYQTQRTRGEAMTRMFLERAQETFSFRQYDSALDLGCGLGSSFLLLAEKFQHVVGVDISMVSLILAKKYIEEVGLEQKITLVCAQADHLPFRDRVFSFISAINVLEHVFVVDAVVSEVYRTLESAGIFTADSRNRFDLFFPEPHVKLMWVGFLPRGFAARYVKWRTGRDYHDTYLLSYWQIKHALHRLFQRSYQITFPKVSAYGYSSKVDSFLAFFEKIGFLRNLILYIFSSHLVIAQRSEPKTA